MAGNKDDQKKDARKTFDDDSDAFFDSLLEDAGVDIKPKTVAAAAPKVETKAKEAEPFQPPARAEAPQATVQAASSSPGTQSTAPAKPSSGANSPKLDEISPSTASVRPSSGATAPKFDDISRSTASARPSSGATSPTQGQISPVAVANARDNREASVRNAGQDSRPQEVPPAPEDFSQEDLALREALSKFYAKHGPEKLSNVNSIVSKYRGINVATLWAQLSLKYNLPVTESLELMGQTLYVNSPFEVASSSDRTKELADAFADLIKPSPSSSPDQSELLRRAIARDAEDGEDRLLRLLTFRGFPENSSPGLRDRKSVV